MNNIMNDYIRERFLRMIEVQDFSRGTLWRFEESVWQEARQGFDPDNTRKEHVGLSMSSLPVNMAETRPFLVGTSKKHPHSLKVKDVFWGSPKKWTFFPIVRPFQISPSSCYTSHKTGRPNSPKSRLDTEELNEFNRLLKNHGIHV